MKDFIVEYHVQEKLKNFYLRKGRWLLHLAYWMFVYVFRQFRTQQPIWDWDGLLWNFLYYNWIIIIFYYLYCLVLVPAYLKKERYGRFWIGIAAAFIILPVLDMYFQLYFQRHVPKQYVGYNFRNFHFHTHVLQFYYIYFMNFLLFSTFLFLMETAEGLTNYREEQEAEEVKLQHEKMLLQTNIDPAFVMHALDGLSALSASSDRHTPDAVIRFSDILRYRLYRSREALVPLADEIAQVRNLFELQNSLYGPCCILETEGNTAAKFIPTLAMVNIAEPICNTFQPGHEWQLIMYLLIEDSQLHIAIEWNAALAHKESVLAAIRKNLSHFYPEEAAVLDTELMDYNYSIRISLPMPAI